VNREALKQRLREYHWRKWRKDA